MSKNNLFSTMFTTPGLTRRCLLRLSGATALVLVPGLSPSVQATASKSDIADASGTVKVLVWEGYENPEAFAGLATIDIEAAYLAANEDTINRTGTPGAFDLLTIYQGMIDPLIRTGRVSPIDPSLIPNFDSMYGFFRDADGLRRDGKLYGVPYTWGTMMVLYDADKTDQPKSFDDLMSPDLTGKVGMPDDAYAVITTFARYAGIDQANSLTRKQLEEVMSLLRTFKPQILSIAPSYGELPAMYGRGEIAVSLPDWTPTLLAAREAGRNVHSIVPQEGAFSFVDSWMLVSGAENEAAAYKVMNEAIGPAAQKVMADSTGLGIVNPEAVAMLPQEIQEAWGYDNLQSNFKQAPIYPGAPIEASGDVTTYQEWIAAWTDFKAA